MFLWDMLISRSLGYLDSVHDRVECCPVFLWDVFDKWMIGISCQCPVSGGVLFSAFGGKVGKYMFEVFFGGRTCLRYLDSVDDG